VFDNSRSPAGRLALGAAGALLASAVLAAPSMAAEPPAPGHQVLATTGASTPAFAYADFLLRLGIDLTAVLALACLVYLKRHPRRDLITVFGCFNVGLLVVLTVISTSRSATAIGFGLFAMLSIIRLRSEPFNNFELGYFFAALVLALVNGVVDSDIALLLGLDALVLVTVFVADHPRVTRATRQRQITLDTIHSDDSALVADLEHRLGVRVCDFTIHETDYVRDVTTLTIRYAERSARRETALAELR
jgi:hypothetical protein